MVGIHVISWLLLLYSKKKHPILRTFADSGSILFNNVFYVQFVKILSVYVCLFRWVKQGLVPYLKATTLLPSDMKFSHSDNNVFKLRVSSCTTSYEDECVL